MNKEIRILSFILGFFLAGCTLTASLDSSSLAKINPSIQSLAVQGENDTQGDSYLKASDTATLQWSAVSQATEYDVAIYDNTGTQVICSEQVTAIPTITLSGCSLADRSQYKVRIKGKDVFGNPLTLLQEFFDFTVQKLRFDKIKPTVYAGDSLPLAGQYGLAPYTITDSGSGRWNAGSGLYTIPTGTLGTSQEQVTITDAENTQYVMPVTVRGFVDDINIEMPAGVDDQVYPADSVWTNAGNAFVGTTSSDAQGERWAVFRSHNNGVSWDKVDHFMGVDYEGESHVMGMTTNGTDIYVCGYVYSYNWNSFGAGATDPASAWVLRKSSDEGQTWSTVDYYAPVAGSNHVCYDVAISPVTGYIYTGGYDSNGWAVRESRDQGATWNTIYSESVGGSNTVTQVSVAPNGDLWVMGDSSSSLAIRKGVYAAGAWTWSGQTATFPASSTAHSDYELGGTLRVISNTTAYFAMTTGTSARIVKTSDGGATWSTVYSAANSMLHGLIVTANGTLLANGGERKSWSPPSRWTVIRSSDNGATWSIVYNRPSVDAGNSGYGLTMTSSPTGNDVIAFAYRDSNYQGMSIYSGDDGTTWTARAEVNFIWKFWTEIYSLVTPPSGDLVVAGYGSNMDGVNRWLVRKSSDHGVTWTTTDDYIPGGASSAGVFSMTRVSSGALIAMGTAYISPNSHYLLRRSSDEGATWTTVLDLTGGVSAGNIQQIVEMNNHDLLAVSPGSSSSSLLKSTDQGQTWSVTALANPPGATSYHARGLSRMSDDSLWILGEVSDGTNTDVIVLKSTDQGATWVEKYRTTYSWLANMEIKSSPAGVLYFLHSNNVYSSADGGNTWTVDPISGVWSLTSFEFDGEKIIVVGGSKAFTKSDYSSNWITLDESSDIPTRHYYDISSVLACPGGGVCLNSHYEDPYKGTMNFLRRLK